MAKPLHLLTKKGEVWRWTKDEKGAFEELKWLITLAPILVQSDQDEKWCLIGFTVKNRFSDPTKVQIGRGWHRIDIMNDHWEKALKEGCYEGKQAWTDVSSKEKTNTK